MRRLTSKHLLLVRKINKLSSFYQDADKQTQSVHAFNKSNKKNRNMLKMEAKPPKVVRKDQYGTEFASQNDAQQVRQQNQQAQSRKKNNGLQELQF